ncbi:MAG: PucR family transcriptional regulator [Sporichthyaceae bacterium]
MDGNLLDSVARGASRDTGGVDPALLGDFLVVAVDAAGTGRRLRRSELTRYRDKGAEAAAAGVALRALIDLYLSAAWRLWEVLPMAQSSDAAAVRAAGLAMLRAADDGVAAVAEGFQVARNDLSRRQESARREVFDGLLAGGQEALAVLHRAADLGIDLTAPHAVLVAEGEFAPDVPRRVEAALQGRFGDTGTLVALKNDRLVTIAAAPDAGSARYIARRVEEVLTAHAAAGWRAALGGAAGGPDGVRASYDQAREALDIAARLGMPGPVVEADDLALHRVILRDRAALDALIRLRLEPLRADRGGPERLLETLDAYYATGANASETARRLHLSVRAVTYRLTRVATLLGVDPTDPAERLALQTAVLGARATGWPATLPEPGNVEP